ncbi:hypothetical protein CH254_02280 [Rhodococcus sp. 06-412-2C]|uniref:helix-turn-helix domain-containing protein n=1 Tax=unclassified Rhodococcus (in: high G+C Gram-positive bacteria) TaxID=192944 RepID=UPI000B9C73A6|nr:hypothetical protein CH254_02280 [Rhodococcus sp. 06-412-2C]OZC95272.1 hypothetical protein CH279_18700 [Rhodococcus sp. 06-412-2B]
MADSNPNAWLTAREAAERARCHPRTLLRAARSGELVGYQRRTPNGAWRFKCADVERWIMGNG